MLLLQLLLLFFCFVPRAPAPVRQCSQDVLLGGFLFFEGCGVVVPDMCMIQEVHLYSLMSPAHICIHALSREDDV